jgi:uncharacterized protein YjbI with pentapeptide repeats
MANADHLAALRQWVDAWNAWREKESSARPDLTDANLGEATLRGTDLRGANLSVTPLRGANLERVNLSPLRS